MRAHSVERTRPVMTSCGVRSRLVVPGDMFASPKSPTRPLAAITPDPIHDTLSSFVNISLRFYELAFVPGYGMIRAQERERKHVEKENCQTRKDRCLAARFD